jgi:hypothetical protein
VPNEVGLFMFFATLQAQVVTRRSWEEAGNIDGIAIPKAYRKPTTKQCNKAAA